MTTSVPTFRSRLWRWTRRLSLLATVAVLAAVPAAAFGVPALSRTKAARARMEKMLTRSLGTPVQVGSMSWSWKQGLELQQVATAATAEQTSFRIDRVQLRPRLAKMLGGKVRFRARIENSEILLSDSGPALRVPRFPKKGIRIDQLDLINSTITAKSGASRESIQVENLALSGTGKVENRALRIDVSSVSGTCDGMSFSGQGSLRLSQEGLSGQIGMKVASMSESGSLKKLFRVLNLTTPKAPVLSEPF